MKGLTMDRKRNWRYWIQQKMIPTDTGTGDSQDTGDTHSGENDNGSQKMDLNGDSAVP